MNNRNAICIMQYNIFKYLKLLSFGACRTSVNPYMPFVSQPFLLSEKCTKIIHKILNEKEDVQIAINKWKTELTP